MTAISFFSGSLLPFSQLGGGRQGEHVTGTGLVLCACIGLLREVSQTQANVEAARQKAKLHRHACS
jgi:hypothetical protein